MTSLKKITSNDAQPMLSARKVAARLKCAPDYVSKLCREGKLTGEQISGQWFVIPSSIDEFESVRVLAKEQRSAQLAEQRRSEQSSYQIENSTLAQQVFLRVRKASFGAPVGMAFGGALLFGALVFAGSMHVPQQNQYAAVSESQSPFFGTQAPTVVLPTSTGNAFAGATNFLSDVFSTLFGQKTKVAEVPTQKPDLPQRGEFPAVNSPTSGVVTPAYVSDKPVSVASAVPSVVNNYPVIERIVERSVAVGGVSEEDLTGRLQDLYNRLAVQISNLQNPGRESPLQNFAVSQVINNLSDVRLNGDTRADGITASSIIAGSLDVSGNTNFSGFLNAGTTTLASLTVSGNSTTTGIAYFNTNVNIGGNTTIAGNLTVLNSGGTPGTALAGTTTVTNLVVTNLSTSTFAGSLAVTGATTFDSTLDVAGNTTLSNATSTNFFSSVASSTNSYTQNLQAAIVSLVNATSTNFFADTASSTSLFSQAASLGTLSTQAFTLSGIGTFTGGFLAAASSTIGGGTQITGLTINGGATTTGNAYFAGGLGVGVATSTAGVLQTSGNAHIGGNLTVVGNSTTLGNSSANTLIVNSSIQSHLVPDQNITYDLGSASFYWRNVYVGNIVANNISAASTTISGTASQTFTLNSDNVTSDTEDMDLVFFRGNVVPNALLSWKSTTDRFEFNQPLFIQNASTDNLAGVTLDLKGLAGQTGDLFRISSSTGTNLFNITSAGLVGIGTTTPNSLFSVQGNAYISGTSFFGGAITATSTLNVTGLSTLGSLTVTGNTTLAGATSTSFAISGIASGSLLKTTTGGAIIPAVQNVDYSTFAYLFPSNATSTSIAFNGGLTAFASSTIGAGTQATGLTINGGATTTGNAYFVGNVGIGAASPLYKLHVNTATDRNLFVRSAYSGQTGITLQSGNDADSAFRVLTLEGSSVILNAATGGNVGIGTTTPQKALSVEKEVLISGNNTAGTEYSDWPNSSLSIRRSDDFVSNGITMMSFGYRNDPTYITDSSVANIRIWDTTQGAGAVTSAATTMLRMTSPGPLTLGAGGTQDHLYINTSGNVGIGTSNPSLSKLQVSSADSAYTFGIMGTTKGIRFGTDSTGGSIEGVDSTLAASYQPLRLNGTYVALKSSDVEILRVTGTNVGIGTTTPNSKLSIEGTSSGTLSMLQLSNLSGAGGDGSAIDFYNGAYNRNARIYNYAVNSNAGQLRFATANGAGFVDAMTISNTGNVGIGTTSPASKFQIMDLVTGLSTGIKFTPYHIPGWAAGTQLQAIDADGTSARVISLNPSGGYVGIGTTSPASTLDVKGTWANGVGLMRLNADSGTTYSGLTLANNGSVRTYFYDDGTYTFLGSVGSRSIAFATNTGGTDNIRMVIGATGNVGVGTTSPFRKFSIQDTVSTAQVTVAYDNSRYTDFLTNSVGDLVVTPQGQDIFSNDSNLWICSGGSCPSGTPTGTGNIVVENNIGIGTTTPQFRLTIESQNATDNLFKIATSTNQNIFVVNATGKIGVGTSTPTQQFSISDRLFVGAGGASGMGTATSTFQGDIKITGKLDVGTIDPVYTIDGVKYATYGHSTIGIKEEAVSVFEITEKNPITGKYETKIDFRDLEKGSDLWIFYQITDFGEKWKNLVITLTASFDGSVFYTKVPNEAAVIISSSEPGEVSARFIANRFDSDKWPNLRPDQDDSYAGHELQTTQGGQATSFDSAQ